jgi:hypothetical protein
MSASPTESEPTVERLLPQTSIRFFAALIGISAVAMFVVRAAVVGDQLWAKCLSVVMATAVGCFIAYALMFLIASVFSTAFLARASEVSPTVAGPGVGTGAEQSPESR